MAQITVESEEITLCSYCPATVPAEDVCRDSNGDATCSTCYRDGTAYVEPLDAALDGGQ